MNCTKAWLSPSQKIKITNRFLFFTLFLHQKRLFRNKLTANITVLTTKKYLNCCQDKNLLNLLISNFGILITIGFRKFKFLMLKGHLELFIPWPCFLKWLIYFWATYWIRMLSVWHYLPFRLEAWTFCVEQAAMLLYSLSLSPVWWRGCGSGRGRTCACPTGRSQMTRAYARRHWWARLSSLGR